MLEALTLFCCSASLLQEKGELWKRQNHTNRLLQSRHGLTSVRCRRRTAFPNLLAAFLMRLDTQPAVLSYCVVGPHSGWHQHSPSFFPAGCHAASQFPACSAPGAVGFCTHPRWTWKGSCWPRLHVLQQLPGLKLCHSGCQLLLLKQHPLQAYPRSARCLITQAAGDGAEESGPCCWHPECFVTKGQVNAKPFISFVSSTTNF